MKSVGNKTFIFYNFQLDNKNEWNVTALPNIPQPPTIKDALLTLPFDLSHGLYHFRFKSQFNDGNQKILGWIDINNLTAKVPTVNGAIHMKILKLKDSSHNKLFHIDKLKKAEIVKINSDHHFQSAPKKTHSPTPPQNPILPQNNPIRRVDQRQPAKLPAVNPAKQPVADPAKSNTPAASLLPEVQATKGREPIEAKPPKFIPTASVEQNLETFSNQFKKEEEDRENQRVAQIDLQDKIRKWGYTDGKKINNTTTLLATLHQIWPQWEAVSLTDMLKPEQVSSLFKKAVIKVHPDKNRSRHFKEKYLSKRVFELLNESRNQ